MQRPHRHRCWCRAALVCAPHTPPPPPPNPTPHPTPPNPHPTQPDPTQPNPDLFAQISVDPLKVHIEHLKDESYNNNDILKVPLRALLQYAMGGVPHQRGASVACGCLSLQLLLAACRRGRSTATSMATQRMRLDAAASMVRPWRGAAVSAPPGRVRLQAYTYIYYLCKLMCTCIYIICTCLHSAGDQHGDCEHHAGPAAAQPAVRRAVPDAPVPQ